MYIVVRVCIKRIEARAEIECLLDNILNFLMRMYSERASSRDSWLTQRSAGGFAYGTGKLSAGLGG